MVESSQKKINNALLPFAYILTVLFVVRTSMTDDETQRVDVIFSLAFPVTFTLMCVNDSKLRGKPILHSLRWLMFFSWPFSCSLYLLWTRRLKGFGKLLMHGFLMLLFGSLSAMIAGYIKFGTLDFDP